jgi:hypothetical protein
MLGMQVVAHRVEFGFGPPAGHDAQQRSQLWPEPGLHGMRVGGDDDEDRAVPAGPEDGDRDRGRPGGRSLPRSPGQRRATPGGPGGGVTSTRVVGIGGSNQSPVGSRIRRPDALTRSPSHATRSAKSMLPGFLCDGPGIWPDEEPA